MARSLFASCAETHPTLPVMVISGLEEAEQEYAGMNVLFRLKPLLPDNLLASVHSLMQLSEARWPDL